MKPNWFLLTWIALLAIVGAWLFFDATISGNKVLIFFVVFLVSGIFLGVLKKNI